MSCYPYFRILGTVEKIRTLAYGTSVKERLRLNRMYGRGRWKKCSGHATVSLVDGTIHKVEVHWFEAHGIGKRELKVKRLLG